MSETTSSGASKCPTFAELRSAMVETQIRRRGIHNERVLHAMASVPRHEFVPFEHRTRAYQDEPLPIGEEQTISQPYIVAAMTVLLRLAGNERVLEIGTGCGYQTAVLSLLAPEVFTIEFRSELARAARERLQRLGYGNVRSLCGDGSLGLPTFAPFDAILVTAAAPGVPSPLTEQLAAGGRMVIPVGTATQQELLLVTKQGSENRIERHEGCRFVPLYGQHGWKGLPPE